MAAAACALLLPVAGPRAQAMQVERRAYAHLEELRSTLLAELLRAEPERREAAARCLIDPEPAQPFVRIGRAFAAVRGVPADDAFCFRAGMLPLALPEILDPSALAARTADGVAALQVTAHAPRILPEIPAVAFRVALQDAEGRSLREAVIDEHTEMQDVLRFRATTEVSIDGLDAGSYSVRLWADSAGETPRATDLRTAARVHVLDGFVGRALALPIRAPLPGRGDQLAALYASLPGDGVDPLDAAILEGACWHVERVFRGEPPTSAADPVVALERAERVFDNLRSERPALDGLTGLRLAIGVPGAVPANDAGAAVGSQELVLVDVLLREPAETPRPLVVVVAGAPAWSPRGERPNSPRTSLPGRLADRLRLAGLGADDSYDLAVVESPGRFADPAASLLGAIGNLRSLLGTADAPEVWIGQREACWPLLRAALARSAKSGGERAADASPDAAAPASTLRGLVLAGGAGPTAEDLDRMPGVSCLVLRAVDGREKRFFEHVAARVGDPKRYRLVAGDGVVWPFELEQQVTALRAFLEQCGIGGD